MPAPSIVNDPSREEHELREYLGDGFSLTSLQQSEARVDEEFAAAADEVSFYRESETYLYNLTSFAMTGTKLPYLCLLYTSPSPRDGLLSRMPSSA